MDEPRTEFLGAANWWSLLTNHVLSVIVRPVITVAAWLGGILLDKAPSVFSRLPLHWTDYAAIAVVPLRGTTVRADRLPHCKAEWVTAPGVAPDAPVVIYYHGGAWAVCGLRTHRRLVSRISAAAGVRVFNVDYRMLPRYTMDDAIADAVDGYRHVLDLGVSPSSIVLAGDSAGGYLAMMVGIKAKELGLPVPGGHALLAGMYELTSAPKLALLEVTRDVLFGPNVGKFVERFLTSNGAVDVVSVTDCDLTGLGRVLIQVGSHEMLRHDAELLATRLDEAGVQRWLQIWDRAPHVFQAGADLLPDARRAIENIGSFIAWVTEQSPYDSHGDVTEQAVG
ncbi:alpha/beta hydrolase [Rhodococcus sp. G-MC3]|uniref:alpha/beta hydrolase n=1 Tax=Rhodococcus sp. G-MC3 TaxID=3046209 RepID=UPI0024BB1D3D|nr:alpha/beta hydrolase [Rhodococcus sp. G-MC3]MDJ0392660.1 alpha/beta hydrolase [Rhodococcus sp. G-MC3]